MGRGRGKSRAMSEGVLTPKTSLSRSIEATPSPVRGSVSGRGGRTPGIFVSLRFVVAYVIGKSN